MARLSGFDKLASKLDSITGPQMVEAVTQAMFTGGQNIQAEAQLSIAAGSASGARHVPSKPGEAPNRDTEFLEDHIEAAVVKPVRVEVASSAPYGKALEYGTSKMAERPYMRPALAKHRENVRDLIAGAIRKQMRKS